MAEIIGTITAVKEQKNNSNRLSIFVDDEFLLGVSNEVFIKHGFSCGDKLSKEDLFDLEVKEEINQAKSYALNLLSYRKRSEQELRDRLKEKDYSPFSIKEVVKILKRIDYLDDLKFSRAWIRDKQKKYRGPLKIRMELNKKGVAESTIEEALAAEYDKEIEQKLALEFVKKRIKRYDGEEYLKKKHKLFQALQRRGFSFYLIETVLEESVVKE